MMNFYFLDMYLDEQEDKAISNQYCCVKNYNYIKNVRCLKIQQPKAFESLTPLTMFLVANDFGILGQFLSTYDIVNFYVG